MKRGQSKSNDAKPVTELAIKLNGQVVLERATVKNLTILDTTLLAVSIMFLPVLFQGMRTESGSLHTKRDENDGTND